MLDLTVVVPYYNPGPVLRATVERAVEVLHGTGISFEIVTVSDGSTDGSDASLDGLDPDVVVQVVLPHGGKGRAVRAGLARGRGRYLGFIDGDGDVPPELLAEFVEVVQRPSIPTSCSAASATPTPRSSTPSPAACTRGATSSWSGCSSISTCATPRPASSWSDARSCAEVLPLMVEQGYAFDLEMLVIARRLGYRDLVEAPGAHRHPLHEHRVAPCRGRACCATPSPSGGGCAPATPTASSARPEPTRPARPVAWADPASTSRRPDGRERTAGP